MDSLSRRQFLLQSAGVAGALALPGIGSGSGSRRPTAERCVVINLVGGPSQHETWDPKPDAPSEVRGPFQSIPTTIPGVRVSELFPRIAAQAHRLAIVRSVHHDAAPIHETGLQLLQTGRLARQEPESPAWFAWLHHATGKNHRLISGPIEATGVPTSHGQSFAFLEEPRLPMAPIPSLSPSMSARYGTHRFGERLAHARWALEKGSPLVTVNLETALSDRVTWDCHADGFCGIL